MLSRFCPVGSFTRFTAALICPAPDAAQAALRAFIQEEREALITLRGIPQGEIAVPLEELYRALDQAGYLWAHFLSQARPQRARSLREDFRFGAGPPGAQTKQAAQTYTPAAFKHRIASLLPRQGMGTRHPNTALLPVLPDSTWL